VHKYLRSSPHATILQHCLHHRANDYAFGDDPDSNSDEMSIRGSLSFPPKKARAVLQSNGFEVCFFFFQHVYTSSYQQFMDT
jgi:hypothetical protein